MYKKKVSSIKYHVSKIILIFLLITISSSLNSIASDKENIKVKKKSKINQKVFKNVPLNTSDKNPCSPVTPDSPDWEGIIIQSPVSVSFVRGKIADDYGAFAIIPICGYFLLSVDTGSIKAPMKMFAVNSKTKKTFKGEIQDLELNPEIPYDEMNKAFRKEELKGILIGSYFNINCINFLDLPEESGTYDIWIEYHGRKSNVVEVKLVAK
jgi:hypothetical protein